MAAVASVWISLRTKTWASAAKTAPRSAAIAPSAWIVEVSPTVVSVSRGRSTITTPNSPMKTAVRRKARTCSPRNIAAKITVRSGAA